MRTETESTAELGVTKKDREVISSTLEHDDLREATESRAATVIHSLQTIHEAELG